MNVCSSYLAEPLAGTAKQESVYVLFEWPGGWSRDVLDGETFGAELTGKLRAKLKGVAGLQLIRRPGRAGRQVGKMHRCYLVWAREAVMEMVLLTGPEQILDLDLTGPGRNGGGVIDAPLMLVCTHAKRDQCCAVKGRPLAAELDRQFPASLVWETSHTKGHRFAPSVLLMPWGYSFGRLTAQAGAQLLARAIEGKFFVPANRGSGLLSPRCQVAELAVAQLLLQAGEELAYGALELADAPSSTSPVRVTHPDGRAWDVALEQREVAGVVSSCGDEPKTARAWVPRTEPVLVLGT
ncbi:sucrase ferredoxin [Corynebacterium lizhenjunii]|uniref:Sucrase ferredoxin n=1 Tax=Corynebacterium lizhenjunii TaxID=2709394 RepID=A0A7T0KG55_9CORY|nr:sucrase ferredoxin [Corynebacterium lizhenjunii]QPK79630.1 sucrase ferredoxin [Corynebacterium lizhenjunii]